jgi:uncharacterized protein (UPF0332 family)
MFEDADRFLEKARENLDAATNDIASGRFKSSASRSYYAAFQSAISALARVGIRPPGRAGYWGHDFVQSQFAGQLVNRRKLYPASLRSVLTDTYLLRESADYDPEPIDEVRARRALRKAQELVRAVSFGRTSR